MRILITLLLTFSFTANACPSYEKMATGSKAKCEGYFFNNSAEAKIRKDVRDNQLRKKQIELKDLQLKELKSDRDKWKEEAYKQSKVSHSKDNDLTKGMIYGAGIAMFLIFAAGSIK